MLVHYGPNTRDLFDVCMLSSISKQVAAHYERRADPNSCEALYVLDWKCNILTFACVLALLFRRLFKQEVPF